MPHYGHTGRCFPILGCLYDVNQFWADRLSTQQVIRTLDSPTLSHATVTPYIASSLVRSRADYYRLVQTHHYR